MLILKTLSLQPMHGFGIARRVERALTRERQADADVADEVAHYLDQATAAWMTRGLPEADARRAAQLEIGNMTFVREQVRTSGWEHGVETLLSDMHYALRRLR